MKSFKSIREGNSVEPGVSEINDVPEDPMSFVEIKPKKTKVVKEGIVDSAANAKVRIFSSIDRKKKELYKNAVKEDLHEAVSVKKEKYSWGNMMTVHHGSDTSYPLHPEHQQAIAKLGDGEKASFKDETNSTVHAHREGDTVHLSRPRLSSTKTSVALSHFNEEVNQIDELSKKTLGSYVNKAMDSARELPGFGTNAEASKKSKRFASVSAATYRTQGLAPRKGTDMFKKYKAESVKEEAEQMNELNKDTLYSYAAKAGKDVDKKHKDLSAQIKSNNPQDANKTSSKIGKRYAGMDRAETRLNKEETVVETKGAPKGFHFTKDGKLKRGDANQDGNGGPMLRSDPLDKQRSKIPAVSENSHGEDKMVELGDLATKKSLKHRVLVTYSDPNHTSVSQRKEKQQKHVRIPSTNKQGETIYSGDSVGLAKQFMKKQGYKVHDAEHIGLVNVKEDVAEGVDFLNVWNNIKLVQENNKTVYEEAPFDPVAHKKEADRLMAKHIDAHKALSKAFSDMKAQGKTPSFDIPENKKLNDIKQEIRNHASKVPRGPAPKPGSPEHYYASKKPGGFTGD